MKRENLTKFAWLSIAAALVTIGLKTLAWLLTGSVSLLSDAAESVVNLVAAIVVLIALTIASKPADKNHHFGHTKAEYFSAAIEGVMIFVAAVTIVYFAVERFINPEPLESLGVGMAVSLVAAAMNGGVGFVLLRADGEHLFTDVVTSVGVVVGLLLVWATGWLWLDPLVALLVGFNILWTGWKLLRESAGGLMDVSLPKSVNARLLEILDEHSSPTVRFHAFRTRVSGSQQFMEMHMLVPGAWTVQKGHDAMEDLIDTICAEFPDLHVSGHLEPIEDPRSYDDIRIGERLQYDALREWRPLH